MLHYFGGSDNYSGPQNPILIIKAPTLVGSGVTLRSLRVAGASKL